MPTRNRLLVITIASSLLAACSSVKPTAVPSLSPTAQVVHVTIIPHVAEATAAAESDVLPQTPESEPAGDPDKVGLNETAAALSVLSDTAVLGDSAIRHDDGMTLFFVPAGSFQMGSSENDPDAGEDEFTQHEVELDSFWVDQTEVTNAQYTLLRTTDQSHRARERHL